MSAPRHWRYAPLAIGAKQLPPAGKVIASQLALARFDGESRFDFKLETVSRAPEITGETRRKVRGKVQAQFKARASAATALRHLPARM